jgi:NADH-quinone oxidoreductase subunit N
VSLDLHLLLPEAIVTATALLVVTIDLLDPRARRATLAPAVSAVGLAVALAVLVLDGRTGEALLGAFRVDAFSRFARALALGGGLLVLGIAAGWTRRMDRGHGEFYALLLFALLGAMLVAGVTDFVSLFVAVELVTVLSYVLAAFKRNDPRSAEAGLKYLVVGAVSSAILLFGIALVYGAVGSLSFSAASDHVASGGWSTLLALGTALVLGGLFFKASAVPFQVWTPDVYQGAPTPVTAFLSSVSKSAGFVLLLRLVQVLVVPAAAAGEGASWAAFLTIVAIATLLFGNLGAIPQRDAKRLLAYSSIGHAGYLMMGVAAVAAAPTPALARDGATAVLFYLLAYYVTVLTGFAVIATVSATTKGHDVPGSYAGLARRSPFLGFAMLLTLLSLAGVPPLAGLVGKFLVFKAVVDRGLTVLALVGAASVVISLYYYLLFAKQMYVRRGSPEDEARPIPVPRTTRAVLWAGMAAMLGVGIYWNAAHEAAADAARALFGVG